MTTRALRMLPLVLVAFGGLVACGAGSEPTAPSADEDAPVVAASKLDVLFVVDNSASMASKAEILSTSVRDILRPFAEPRCVAEDDPSRVLGSSKDGACEAGVLEHAPIEDIHVGVVSSSLGSVGGDVCPERTARFDDRAHLLTAKKAPGTTITLARAGGVLAYAKGGPTGTIGDIATLEAEVSDIVLGVGESGCGIESQLEAMYRFLVQPDPWTRVHVDTSNQATLGDEIDYELLAERAACPGPHSAVLVVMLTDEDDASVDPRAIGGQAWTFAAQRFPGSKVLRAGDARYGTTAPRATSACDRDPASPDCTSCAFQATCDPADAACQRVMNDPACKELGQKPRSGDDAIGYAGYYAPTLDFLSVRFHETKRRFGVDPLFPVSRYVNGLSSRRVPSRATEHAATPLASGRLELGPYEDARTCTNPLFAASLPALPGDETCDLPPGPRSRRLVHFALVGGVPRELLAGERTDWTRVLGRDPSRWDRTGIDPHMIPSVTPRAGIASAATDERGDNGADPVHGREWNTFDDDLQYACTFDLPAPRTCRWDDPSCDCASVTKNPPLCSATWGEQIKAKAYPSLRELEVAKELGDRALVESICQRSYGIPALQGRLSPVLAR